MNKPSQQGIDRSELGDFLRRLNGLYSQIKTLEGRLEDVLKEVEERGFDKAIVKKIVKEGGISESAREQYWKRLKTYQYALELEWPGQAKTLREVKT